VKSLIVLAMHGAPPNDFPREKAGEFFRLHARFGLNPGSKDDPTFARYLELESEMVKWPRTPINDPFRAGAVELADELKKSSGLDVIVGFNEFCAPSLDETLDEAASLSPEKVIVVTPMLTKGGEHAARDIPEAIKRAQSRHPGIPFVYAWPFETEEVGRFLAEQINRFL